MATYQIVAFRGFHSHTVRILNAEELPWPVRHAFLAAVEAGQIRLKPGFPQDAQEIVFEYDPAPGTAPEPSEREKSPFRRCKLCGEIKMHTTAPAHGCDDCV